MVRSLFIILICLSLSEAYGQFATAELSRKKVVVEQSVRVKITAYSPTWFAEPLSFSNLQINGAFIQSFSKTIPGIKYVEGKKYATLEFFYILFPYKDGELIFPELTLTTSIPEEGEYKGKPVTLKTKAMTLQVDPVPSNTDQEHWIVANNIRISNQWSADLNSVKVGDVLIRTVTIKAAGTLPSFIDEPEIGTADFASIYTTEPEFIDDRDEKNVNGQRIDKYSYLIEQTGTFTIPEVSITWWNPNSAKYFSRKLPAYEILVSENPDMSSLLHLKDSLNSLGQPAMMEAEEAEKELDYAFWLKVLLVVYVIYKLVRLVLKVLLISKFISRQKEKRRLKKMQYLQSEAYQFDQVKKQDNSKGMMNALYRWLDSSDYNIDPKDLETLSHGDKEFENEVLGLQKEFFSSGKAQGSSLSNLKHAVSNWRKEKLRVKKHHINKYGLQDINP
jgi:hypothetical protein